MASVWSRLHNGVKFIRILCEPADLPRHHHLTPLKLLLHPKRVAWVCSNTWSSSLHLTSACHIGPNDRWFQFIILCFLFAFGSHLKIDTQFIIRSFHLRCHTFLFIETQLNSIIKYAILVEMGHILTCSPITSVFVMQNVTLGKHLA